MFKILYFKELKALLYSPRFLLSFALCSVLLVTSFWIGIQEYRNALEQHNRAEEMVRQSMTEQRRWAGLSTRAYRLPDAGQILSSGVAFDLGRFSSINRRTSIQLDGSMYAQDPLFALFRLVDPALIVQVIFSLFAIVFTYDAVCGEREDGTLKLMMANAVRRSDVIAAKVLGAVSGFLFPLAIPLLICAILALGTGVYRTPGDWAVFGSFAAASALYLLFFMVLGIAVSTMVRQAPASFLTLLVVWIAFVLIVPRAGVMMAGQLIDVPGAAEIESRRSAYERQQWDAYATRMADRMQERTAMLNQVPEAERAAKREEMEWDWSEQDAAERRTMESDITAYRTRLEEEARNQAAAQEVLAMQLARISPASMYQLAVNRLAGTSVHLKSAATEAMKTYAGAFNAYVDEKARTSGDQGGIRITFDSATGPRFDFGTQRTSGLDVSDAPVFRHQREPFLKRLQAILPETAMLLLGVLACFAAAFAAFLRYDVR